MISMLSMILLCFLCFSFSSWEIEYSKLITRDAGLTGPCSVFREVGTASHRMLLAHHPRRDAASACKRAASQ